MSPLRMTLPITALVMLTWVFSASAKPQEFRQSFTLTNTLNESRSQQATYIPLDLVEKTALKNGFVTMIEQSVVPNQLVDRDHDGEVDAILVVVDYAARSSKKIVIISLLNGRLAPVFAAQTQAEMGVRIAAQQNAEGIFQGGLYQAVTAMDLPSTHKIGDKLFKYEGFGWESANVAYRMYFDERALVDIFGKRKPAMVLQRVGLDGTDYHTLADWGMDILKVGNSLGLGGIGFWRDNTLVKQQKYTQQSIVLNNGPLQSSAALTQSGWSDGATNMDIKRTFTTTAGSSLSHVALSAEKSLGEMALGIVRHKVQQLHNVENTSEWNYMATYGKQSLADDELGMALFFRHEDWRTNAQDADNELVIISADKTTEYYFVARWVQEQQALQNLEEFKQYLEYTLRVLNHPISVARSMN
ncbi:MAG: DUF4861 domain-containing protein [Paraglaciecola sp.]|nr:DUF4861 domain-containing protein [Paraglaciecola sp.]NCT46701.1 DUF4861 domain-containing protein [Paraglaciecola sp.]